MPIESSLAALGFPWRSAGPDAWGLTLPDVAGWPLEIGLRVRGPSPALLAFQAPVCEAGLLDPAQLLHRNRRLALVRFSATQAGEVWVQAELPWPVTDDDLLEAVLARLVGAAQDARYAASIARTERSR